MNPLVGFYLAAAIFVIVGAEVVIRVLRHRMRQMEADFERDFNARVDEELPGLYEDESE